VLAIDEAALIVVERGERLIRPLGL